LNKNHLAAIGKILVVRLSSIGDIILTTPLLRSLRTTYPGARITFVIKRQYEELLSSSPYIDELITFDKREGLNGLRRIKQDLREQRFDLYLDIHKNWRSRYLRFCLHARKTTSYRKLILKRTLLIWFKINLYKTVKPVYQRYFDSVRHLGIHYDGLGTEIHVPSEKTEIVKSMLSEAGYTFDAPLVILCPSATYANKRWKSEGFVDTARHLITVKTAFVVVHGGKEDVLLCADIASAIGSRAVSMAGLLSLSESAALMQLSDLVIANDSGLLHLAQSQKKPVIGIYGATTRELGYFPIEQNSTVIETDLSCRPCTHNGLNKCPKKHFRCMKDIPSEKVIKAAMNYLH
jgi:lipopolysaccharide heptosyltransferase II